MQLLGPVVDVYEKEIVQEEILDEIVLVETLPVGNRQLGQLEGQNPGQLNGLGPVAQTQYNILQLVAVIDLCVFVPPDDHGIGGRARHLGSIHGIISRIGKRRCKYRSVAVKHSEITLGDLPDPVNRFLQHLI